MSVGTKQTTEKQTTNLYIYIYAGPNGRAVYGVGLRPLAC